LLEEKDSTPTISRGCIQRRHWKTASYAVSDVMVTDRLPILPDTATMREAVVQLAERRGASSARPSGAGVSGPALIELRFARRTSSRFQSPR
jgi:hypothetical protein